MAASQLRRPAQQGLLPIESISPRPDQPRTIFDVGSFEELKDSIREQGIIEPLVVRPKAQRYEIVCGERRYRAALGLKIDVVPVRVIELGDDEAFLTALHENIHRNDLNVVDLARSCRRLLDEGWALTQEGVAKLMGVSQSRVSQLMGILEMPKQIIARLSVSESRLSERHARHIARVEDPNEQLALALLVEDERLSVEETAARVRTLITSRAPSARRRKWVAHATGARYSTGGKTMYVELKGDASQRALLLREIAERVEKGL